MAFKTIRDPRTGHVVFKHDPDRGLVEIKARELTGGVVRVYDLKEPRKVDTPAPPGIDSNSKT